MFVLKLSALCADFVKTLDWLNEWLEIDWGVNVVRGKSLKDLRRVCINPLDDLFQYNIRYNIANLLFCLCSSDRQLHLSQKAIQQGHLLKEHYQPMRLLQIIFGIHIIPGPDIWRRSIKQQVQLIIGSFQINNYLDNLWIEMLCVTLWNDLD